MSEQVERRLFEILDQPNESPYGNPIPGLEELGGARSPEFMSGVVGVVPAVKAGGGEPVSGTIRRLGEPVQFEPELLKQLRDAGVVPGAKVTLSISGAYIVMDVEGGDGLELPTEVAAHVFIEQ